MRIIIALFAIVVLAIVVSDNAMAQPEPVPCEGCVDNCPQITPTLKSEDSESDYNEGLSSPGHYVYDAPYTALDLGGGQVFYKGCMNLYFTVKNCNPEQNFSNLSIEYNTEDIHQTCDAETEVELSFPDTQMPSVIVNRSVQ